MERSGRVKPRVLAPTHPIHSNLRRGFLCSPE